MDKANSEFSIPHPQPVISSLLFALKTIGINTYLLTKLYVRDLHSPMTDQEITKMHTMIKTFFPRFTNTILFTLPIHDGYGLNDLKHQLKGRRAKIIYNLSTRRTGLFEYPCQSPTRGK